ncbi:MBL fold metallo-hydrolase [Myxococcota bacterium]|nr:MBL fold metallo-hydrolase [Myxococcota bacterium]
METPFIPTDHVVTLPSHEPAPGYGYLPVHAYLLQGAEPVLVDTGMARESAAFLEALDTVIDPAKLRWIVLTHEDADHSGSVRELLDRAPAAKLLTSAVGYGKLLAGTPVPFERVAFVEPGQDVTLGAHRFRVIRPPMFDSPATLALFERTQRWLFTSDAFGAFVEAPLETADALDAKPLEGLSTFCGMNSPWLADTDERRYSRRLDDLHALEPSWIFGTHLPPVGGRAFGALVAEARALPAKLAAARGGAQR